MKKIIILFAMGLFVSCSATRGSRNFLINREISSLYKIKKIKNEKSFYTIYAARNDSTFKIISHIDNTSICDCEKIKVGNSYILDLKTVFPLDSLFGKAAIPNLGIRGYNVGYGKMVMLEEKSHNKIYTSLNLNGLCVKK